LTTFQNKNKIFEMVKWIYTKLMTMTQIHQGLCIFNFG